MNTFLSIRKAANRKNCHYTHIFRVTTAQYSKNSIIFASEKSQRVARKTRKVSHCEIGGDDLKDWKLQLNIRDLQDIGEPQADHQEKKRVTSK